MFLLSFSKNQDFSHFFVKKSPKKNFVVELLDVNSLNRDQDNIQGVKFKKVKKKFQIFFRQNRCLTSLNIEFFKK